MRCCDERSVRVTAVTCPIVEPLRPRSFPRFVESTFDPSRRPGASTQPAIGSVCAIEDILGVQERWMVLLRATRPAREEARQRRKYAQVRLLQIAEAESDVMRLSRVPQVQTHCSLMKL